MTTTIDSDLEARLDQLLASLTLERKVRLLTGADLWSTYPEPGHVHAPQREGA